MRSAQAKIISVKNHNNLTLQNDIDFDSLPQWLQDATTCDAYVGTWPKKYINNMKKNLKLVNGLNATFLTKKIEERQHSDLMVHGTWIDGEWFGGTFVGTWHNGTWHRGIFSDGHFKNGLWKNGLAQYESTFENCIWENGINDGSKFALFNNSVWKNGLLAGGTLFKNSVWENGKFYHGTFEQSTWINGVFYKNATWGKDNTWISGKYGNRHCLGFDDEKKPILKNEKRV